MPSSKFGEVDIKNEEVEQTKSRAMQTQTIRTEEEEYDPFSDRPPGPLTSDFGVFMHLVKSSLGTGILFLPHAFKRTGYVTSIISGTVIGLIATHLAVRLIKCSQSLCRRNRIPSLDFAKTAEFSFLAGPPWIRKYGRRFGVLTNVIVCFVQCQAAIIYILYVSTSFKQIIEFFSGNELDIRVYLLIFFPTHCMLALVRNLKHLAPFSVIGTIFLAFSITVTVAYLVSDFPDPSRLKPFTGILPVPMYCAIFLYALHNITLYLPLENAMKHPRHMCRLIILNMVLNVIVYTCFGFFGYNKYINACDTIIKNLPTEMPIAQVVKVASSLSVFFTFGLVYYVPMSILCPLLRAKFKNDFRYEYAFRLAGVAVLTLVAAAVPQMIPLLGLFAAVGIASAMLLIPILIETGTKWEEANVFLHVKNSILFLVYLLILIFGVLESTLSMFGKYEHEDQDEC